MQVVEIQPWTKEDDIIFKKASQTTNQAKGHLLCQTKRMKLQMRQLGIADLHDCAALLRVSTFYSLKTFLKKKTV